jgi:hypothetical protein
MLTKRVSLGKIVSSDYAAQIGLIMTLVGWGFFLYFRYIQNDPSMVYLYIALGATVIGLPLLAWRWQSISALLDSGTETNAVIHAIGFFRGRGQVAYTYTINGQKYLTTNAIMKNKHTQILKPGDTVTLVVDRENPKKALIRDLYSS